MTSVYAPTEKFGYASGEGLLLFTPCLASVAVAGMSSMLREGSLQGLEV